MAHIFAKTRDQMFPPMDQIFPPMEGGSFASKEDGGEAKILQYGGPWHSIEAVEDLDTQLLHRYPPSSNGFVWK